ncbi:MAG: FecR domain-containing protein [Candidatus Pedobacter colombiensis]|uniref:FecR domain-containing protein n=1 Tax=Candidatus Pedobacter colombiensis TaxID=3121371 RepID=A0AAJ5W2Y8_9SPHI|nr:FecR domain-containing protein [Pedobacter sp.]WEK17528.1 MAG: FecR domain-containing protein [Pedobacter sp.]
MIFSFFKSNNQKEQDKAADAQKLYDVVDAFKKNPDSWNEKSMGDEEAAEERILNRLLLNINKESKNRLILKRIAVLSTAAVLLVGISIGFLFKDELLDQLITYPQIIVATKNAEREKVTLPDGSVVLLNAGTRLSYPEQFKSKVREVVLLEGEAYFDIRHDSKKPFIVKADKTKTTVLGTAFNIRAYKFNPNVIVTVSRGKVSVDNHSADSGRQQYFLLPNQQITYAKKSGFMQKNDVEAKDALGWMDGKLLFVNESFSQAASLLENKYNVKIDFEDESISDYHFSGAFEASENLYDVLNQLVLTKGLQYHVENKNIKIFHRKP